MLISRRFGSGLRVVAAMAMALPFVACDSDTVLPPMTVVTPPPPTRVVLIQTSYTDFKPGEWLAYPVPLTVAGTLDITVEWTFPESWIYVYFGDTSCSYEEIDSGTCPYLISSETTTPKPRVLNTDTLQPGTYYLVLYNVPWDPKTQTGGFAEEAIQITVGVTVASADVSQPVALGQPLVIRH